LPEENCCRRHVVVRDDVVTQRDEVPVHRTSMSV
jgi:hypothetical protein